MAGYPKLGTLMGSHPEYAIFRRFGALNAENLLYLQAEIQDLEILLRIQQSKDKSSTDQDQRIYDREWCTLKECCEAEAYHGRRVTQWSLILQIREKIKEYNAALLQESAVIKLGHPQPICVNFLQAWMQRPAMGDIQLLGGDRKIWSEPDLLDMVSLHHPTSEGLFSNWAAALAMEYFHKYVGRHWIQLPESAEYLANTTSYHDITLLRVARFFATVVACTLPVLSMSILYSVGPMAQRLGIIGVLTTAFSLCMGLITTASVEGIFAATAAFAAVQVVFVGTSAA
ncbi:hypothetical protein BJ875DRAFT_376161 [Amylocarpus encephaloides]|uniref:DUF6594 domain-containing protein n=1 Tax=Amylocarpus encephaloides TaxID=45428 RepID=A0A9P7YJ51_9HELO|nr:hypothetical protein BJ875DRAFT_376161 [Amylocarpus encephaloides]